MGGGVREESCGGGAPREEAGGSEDVDAAGGLEVVEAAGGRGVPGREGGAGGEGAGEKGVEEDTQVLGAARKGREGTDHGPDASALRREECVICFEGARTHVVVRGAN